MTTTQLPNPSELSLDELRKLRQQLQLEDDAVSYARRVAQARLDLVKAEAVHRTADGETEVGEELRSVLSQHLTGGPARPPRPTEDLSDHPLAVELDAVCSAGGLGHLKELDDNELAALTEAIAAFESRLSIDRRERFDRLDALSAELVRRYRDGEANVDSLHAD
ncbi:MAG: hypothetical protein WBP59_06095 [Ilumatobacteraceae bacterium]